MRVRGLLCLLLLSCARTSGVALFEAELAVQEKSSGLRESVAVASVVGDAYWPSVAPDGSAIVFTAAQYGTVDVWKRELATGETMRLTSHSADDEDPAFSPDGKKIAFVSRRDDAKGDIFLMNRDGSDQVRITDEKTSERAPSWTPDGKALLISLRTTPDVEEEVYRLDLQTKTLTQLTDKGGFDASVDPSGRFLIYSQPSRDSVGRTTTRIVGKRLSDGKIVSLGDGRRPEAFARVTSIGGKTWIYFTRYVEDDNQDGRIDVVDLPSVYRVPIKPELWDSEQSVDFSEPMTSGYTSETLSAPAAGKLFFVASGVSGLEIQTLPLDGLVTQRVSTKELFALADSDIPARMRRYFLRVIQARGGPDALRARYELARDFANEDRLEDAQAAFARVVELSGATTPIGRLARLEQLRNQFFLNQKDRGQAQGALLSLRERVREVAPPDGSKLVLARANVVLAEAAEFLSAYSQGLEYAQAVPRTGEEYSEDAVRAMRVEASASSLALPPLEEQRRLIALMIERPKQVREAKTARARVFELMPKDPGEKLEAIHQLLPLCEALVPVKVALALAQNEALILLGQPALAAQELEVVLARKDLGANDRGRALYALGHTQEVMGDLSAALRSFGSLMTGSQFNRIQKNRGRAELLRLALKKAQADEAKGDTLAAFEAYRTLARNNFAEAAAHRKVLQLGELLGQSVTLAKEYRDLARAEPYDRVAQYANALAATYSGDLSEAKKGFLKAIDLDAGFAYAHLGLGWVYEQEEYRSPDTSDVLQLAVKEYETALSLFKIAERGAGGRSDVYVETAMNLGNAFARLNQFDQAFANYLLREKSHVPFASPAQEIIFRERFGQAAVRAGEYDVALMSLRDGIRLADREGDDRRLGRMRAMLALTYSSLDMPQQARASLVKARDEYATRGDFDRVVAIDRTLGWLALDDGDENGALEALERSLELIKRGYGPRGFKFGLRFNPLTYVYPLAVDSSNTSRAPYGFSREDEEEILEQLLGRVFARAGDTAQALRFLELRLGRLSESLETSAVKDFLFPEWFQASAELMLLAIRMHDFKRASDLFVAASARFAKLEKPPLVWFGPVLLVLPKLPVVGEEQQETQRGALAALRATFTRKDDSGKLEAQSALALAVLDRAASLLSALAKESAATRALPGSAKEAAETLPQLLAGLDVDSADATASQPASAQASSLPMEEVTSRAFALARVQQLFDDADELLLRARFDDAEPVFAQISALSKRYSLFECEWQIAYARYRLGPKDGRAKALQAAESAVRDADVFARLLYPERSRPQLWHELMRALLATALAAKDPLRIAFVLERISIESVSIPEGLARPDLTGAEDARVELAAWAQRARTLMHGIHSSRSSERQERELRDHLASGLQRVRESIAEPWQSMLLARVNQASLATILEQGDSFEWVIPGSQDRLRLVGKALVLVGPDTPASAPASAATTPMRYVAGASDEADVLHVASANALALAFAARNSNNGQSIDFGVGALTDVKMIDSAVPSGASTFRGAAADRDRLAAEVPRKSIVRLALNVDAYQGAPGVVRFTLAGANTVERRLTSRALPSLAINPNLAIVDSLTDVDTKTAADMSRAFALAGTPSLLVCSPVDVETHTALMRVFYQKKAEQRAADAWHDATLAQTTTKWQAAAARCQYWGYASDGADARQAFAKKRVKDLEKLANDANSKKAYVEAKALFQQAREYAQFLIGGEQEGSEAFDALRNSILLYESKLATICTLKDEFDDAIYFQSQVIEKWRAISAKKPADKPSLYEATNLLGIIYSRARRHAESAETFRLAAEGFSGLGNKAREAMVLRQRGSSLQAAGAYREAVDVYQASVALFKTLAKPNEQITALRYIGITFENNLSEFAPALATFSEALKLAEELKDTTLIIRTQLDVGRLQRQLAEYDAALKTVRALLDVIPKDDLQNMCEATLELARIYWFSNDYERALVAQDKAKKIAAAARLAAPLAKNPADVQAKVRTAEFLSIQCESLAGLILMSQGKRIAATNRLRTALRLARVSRRREEESKQLNNFGFTLRERGMLDAAGKAILKAAAIDGELKSVEGLAFDFRNIAAIRLRQGAVQEAKQYLAQAQELNAKVGGRYNGMNILLVEGEIALVEKRTADCKRAFDATVAEAVKLKSRDIEWKARLGLALNLLAEDPKGRGAARVLLEEAVGIVDSLGPKLEDVRSAEVKINSLTTSNLLATLVQTYVDDKDVKATWRLLERLRLKELRDQISPYTWTVRLGVKNDDANDYSKLAAAAKAKGDSALVPVLTLEASGIEALRSARPRDAIVSVRVIDTGILALIADGKGVRTLLLPMQRDEVSTGVNAWIDAVDHLQPPGADAIKLQATLARLFDDSVLAQGRVLIVTDPAFSRVPWASLMIKGVPMIERAALSFEISGTHAVLAAARKYPAVGSVVTVGPTEEDELPFARLEVEETAALFRERGVTVKSKTLKEFYRSGDGASRLWHLAVHGNSTSRSMEGAFLQSGETRLFAVEFLESRKEIPTVLLSACHVPSSEPDSVEFVGALRLSGTDRVITPSSRVFDDQGALFVKHIVRLLAEDGSVDMLRALQRRAYQRGEPASVWANWQWYGRVD